MAKCLNCSECVFIHGDHCDCAAHKYEIDLNKDFKCDYYKPINIYETYPCVINPRYVYDLDTLMIFGYIDAAKSLTPDRKINDDIKLYAVAETATSRYGVVIAGVAITGCSGVSIRNVSNYRIKIIILRANMGFGAYVYVCIYDIDFKLVTICQITRILSAEIGLYPIKLSELRDWVNFINNNRLFGSIIEVVKLRYNNINHDDPVKMLLGTI